MEFAQAAAGLGLRAIHGAEMALEDGRHVTLLVEDATGWRNLCRIVTRAHAHDRDKDEPPPRGAAGRRWRSTPPGLVCLSGCARHGVHDEPTLRRLHAIFGRRPPARRAAAPVPARRPRAQPRARRARRRGSGVPTVATGNVHAHARSRAPLQDAFVALRNHTTLDASEPLRRGNFSHVLASPGGDGGALRGPPAARSRETARARRPADASTSPRTSATATPARRTRRPRARSPSCAAQRFEERYPPGSPHRATAPPAPRGGAARDRRARPRPASSSCTATCSSSRARSPSRCAGPDSARALLPPGRGRGSSVSSIVCYLTGLSHIDPIANELFLGRFLNEELTALPDIDLDFPRDIREVLIPRVHDRYGRERSALVAAFPTFRSRGAIRELGKVLGLPAGRARARRARGGAVRGARRGGATSRPRSGSSPAARPRRWLDPDSRARRSRCPPPSGWRWSTAATRTTTRSAARRRARAAPRCPAAGRGSRGCATRPTGCRATSPSTRAG